jgi:hypothetical protein
VREEREITTVGSNQYYQDQVTPICLDALVHCQRTSTALDLIGSLVNAVRMGNKVAAKDAMKLLPDPRSNQPEEGEIVD